MIKSYKFKIRKPNKEIVQTFEQWLDICRELYNAGLQERRDAWKLNKENISYFDQQNQIPELKKSRKDLKQVYNRVLLDSLRRLDKTFKNFFRQIKKGEKAGYPRFKSDKRFNSFCFNQVGFKLQGDKLKLSKIGTVRIHLSREIEGTIKTCTIKRQVDGWFVIFVVECEPKPLKKTGKTVGIDVGLNKFATLSDGETIENPKLLRASERRLKTAQRNVTRKKIGSNNRKKAVRLLRKQYLKIKRQRKDFLFKLANNLVKEYDEIAVEELNIKGMLKNHHLAKSISDASWAMFISILESKAEEAGKRVWKVNAKNTSQDCSGCGERVCKSLAVRIHKCDKCGLEMDRDLNASINIKARALPLGMS